MYRYPKNQNLKKQFDALGLKVGNLFKLDNISKWLQLGYKLMPNQNKSFLFHCLIDSVETI